MIRAFVAWRVFASALTTQDFGRAQLHRTVLGRSAAMAVLVGVGIANGSAEGAEVLPENRPRLPGRTADENVGMIDALLVLDVVRITVVTGESA